MNAIFPIRKHIDCNENDCQTCLDDHTLLGNYIEEKIGYSKDWLGEYRLWLDTNLIPAEVNGWGSRECFDKNNVDNFINEYLKE